MLQKYSNALSWFAGVSVYFVSVSVMSVSVPFSVASVRERKASLKVGHLRTEMDSAVPSFMTAWRCRPVQRTVSTCMRFTMVLWWMRQNMPMGKACSK